MAGVSFTPPLQRISARAIAWPVAHPAHTVPLPTRMEPLLFPGPGFVAGTVKVLSIPCARPVRLYDRATGRLLRQTASDGAGAYRFERLALGRQYVALALDDATAPTMYNAAVADMVTAGTT